jgi:hypothetical protein
MIDDVDPVLQLAQGDVAQSRVQRATDVAGRRLSGAQLVVDDLHPPAEQQQTVAR